MAWLAMVLFVSVATAEVYGHQYLHFTVAEASGPVDHYLWELADGTRVMTDGRDLYYIPKPRQIHQVRCRAVDVNGNEGEWSELSNSFRVYQLPVDGTHDGIISAPDFHIMSVTFGNQGWEIVK